MPPAPPAVLVSIAPALPAPVVLDAPLLRATPLAANVAKANTDALRASWSVRVHCYGRQQAWFTGLLGRLRG